MIQQPVVGSVQALPWGGVVPLPGKVTRNFSPPLVWIVEMRAAWSKIARGPAAGRSRVGQVHGQRLAGRARLAAFACASSHHPPVSAVSPAA